MRWSLFFRIEWENLFTLSPMYQSRGKNRHSKSLQGLFFSRQVVFCLCSRRVDRSTLLRHFKYYYECFKIGAIQLELLFSGFVFVYLQGWLGWSPRTQKRQLLKQEGGGGMNRRVTREKWKKSQSTIYASLECQQFLARHCFVFLANDSEQNPSPQRQRKNQPQIVTPGIQIGSSLIYEHGVYFDDNNNKNRAGLNA